MSPGISLHPLCLIAKKKGLSLNLGLVICFVLPCPVFFCLGLKPASPNDPVSTPHHWCLDFRQANSQLCEGAGMHALDLEFAPLGQQMLLPSEPSLQPFHFILLLSLVV